MKRRGFACGAIAIAMACAFGCSDGAVVQQDGTVTPDAMADRTVELDRGPDPDGPVTCALSIDRINGKAIANVTRLTGAEDKNTSLSGIQIDLEVGGRALPDGTTVSLDVTDLTGALEGVSSGGKALFSDVTVSSAIAGGKVLFVARAPGCQSARLSLDIEAPPECVFVEPKDGALLGQNDDKDPSNNTFDFDVKIKTTNAVGGTVKLSIGGNSAGSIDPIAGSGNATFFDSVLSAGQQELVAELEINGVKGSCRATVSVQTDKPGCTIRFVPGPVPTADGRNGLGAAQDAKPSTAGIESNIEVETEVGASVTLTIDGQDGAPVSADASGSAVFVAQPLADGEYAIQATCNSTISGNSSQSAPVAVVVDASVPAPPTDFSCAVENHRLGHIRCSWTSVGPSAGVYVVRYSNSSALSETSWPTAQTSEMRVAPFPAGQPQSVLFADVPFGLTYYLAVRAVDGVGNLSSLAHAVPAEIRFKAGALKGVPARAGEVAGWGAEMVSGDFNCDGNSDLAVGDPNASHFDGNAWLVNAGRVAIYFGNSDGFLDTSTFFNGTVEGGRFGAKLAVLQDFNGDASPCNDLVVVASNGGTSAARAFVYLGRPALFARDDLGVGSGAEFVFGLPTSAGVDETLGQAVSSAGDFNGDGATDLALSHRTGATGAEVIVVSGDKSAVLMAAGRTPVVREVATGALTVVGPLLIDAQATPQLALSGGVSLDGDAFGDLLIGLPADGQGTVYALAGAATPAAAIALSELSTKIAGGAASVAFGSRLAIVGDMDKDGTIEFAVADPGFASGAGTAYVFNLAANPTTLTDALIRVTNDLASPSGDQLGITLADGSHAGDFNGDGYADLVLGAQAAGAGVGVVYVFRGGPAPLPTTVGATSADHVIPSPAGANAFGMGVIWAKDINGDGINDLIAGDAAYAEGGTLLGRVHYFY